MSNWIITRGIGSGQLLATRGYGAAERPISVYPSILSVIISIFDAVFSTIEAGEKQQILYYSPVETEACANSDIGTGVEYYTQSPVTQADSQIGASIELYSPATTTPDSILVRI